MPEVCEVALTSHILMHHLRGKTITEIKTYNPYNKLTGLKTFNDMLPLKVKNIKSKGKFLWFVFNSIKASALEKIYLMNGFGLEGRWSLTKPPHPIIKMTTSKGLVIWFGDPRPFGFLYFTTNRDDVVKYVRGLAQDALKTKSLDLSKIRKYKRKIVTVLMDQKAVVSGIGNYLVAEILYKAKISPHQVCSKMSDEQIKKLTGAIKYLTKICYQDNHTGYMENLEDQQKVIRKKVYHPEIKLKEKTFQFKVYGIRKGLNPDGFTVKKENIIGKRTTYWVPEVQLILN